MQQIRSLYLYICNNVHGSSLPYSLPSLIHNQTVENTMEIAWAPNNKGAMQEISFKVHGLI